MIERRKEITILWMLLRRHRVVGLRGARQVGKTTLARHLARFWPGPVAYFDLENPEDQARLADPLPALKPLRPPPARGQALCGEIAVRSCR